MPLSSNFLSFVVIYLKNEEKDFFHVSSALFAPSQLPLLVLDSSCSGSNSIKPRKLAPFSSFWIPGLAPKHHGELVKE
jgi:hypothetical protein